MAERASRHPLVIVAAVASNGVIGVRNTLPWRLGSDLKRFRALTTGKPLVMGRRTFESLPPARPGKDGAPALGRLPGRPLVVLSRSALPVTPEDGEVARACDLDEALALADAMAMRDGADEIVIAGGGDVFAQALPLAERLHLTWVDAAPDGDAFFPAIPADVFREVRREAHAPGERDDHAFAFVDYERRRADAI
ncbi:dihydrofolate reductase [Pseudochelatococcus lubricantis]|uniref:Dihydrofolate reductase n=1 Tax=Pseudochelatococcus lubricantis TaxID=1538102 RepID=A0ABX0V0F9_9HYPH|nr:dihydrofolate reductase [Pseudochelatococcus lubricantis]NIJ57740.1 dihydrofolate reductase [Pseudochelatococcus lubricantis]